MGAGSFWHQKCAIITGASSGIGWKLADLLAARGARVGLMARREPLLNELARLITSRGGRAACAVADVADLPAVRTALRTLEDELGPCDVLIANAGIYRKTSGGEFDPVKADAVVATNLQGVIHAIGAVLPGMVKRRSGHLAAVASMAGALGLPGAAAYSASKAAVITLLESLRVDLRLLGIKVTTICPAYVDTPMITDGDRATIKNLVSAQDAARRIVRAIERGRAECWFPWSTRLSTKLARWLPCSLYDRIMVHFPEMEESRQEGAVSTSGPGLGKAADQRGGLDRSVCGQLQADNARDDDRDASDSGRVA
jgi:short-subunit dehydrogenase